MKTFKGAVVGLSGVGRNHGRMMRETGRIDVVAVCDTNESLAAAALEGLEGAKFFGKCEDMLRDSKPDVVTLAIPHNLHAPVAIAALEAGVNVIVEKPMATRYEDCLAMMEAARANDRFVTVYHNRRLDSWFLTARAAIEAGYLGKLVHVASAINYGPGPQTWRGYKEASGGLMFDWGCHLVDYVLQLTDEEVEAVSGYLYRRADKDPALVEDHGVVWVRFASGAMGEVTISGIAQAQPPRYRIVGEKGTLIDEWQWQEGERMKVETKLSGGAGASMSLAYTKSTSQVFYDNIAAHLAGEAPLMVSPESAARVINVLCTAERSHAQGGAPLPLA